MRRQSLLSCLLILTMIGSLFGFGTAASANVPAGSGAAAFTPEDLGAPVQPAQTLDIVFGREDGANVAYTTVTGSPSAGESAVFNVIDLDQNKLVRELPLPDAANAWSHAIDAQGRVFIGASSKMFMYDPATKKVADLGVPIPGTSSIWSLTAGDDGNVYGGIYSSTVGGRVFKIDGKTLKVTDLLGKPVDDGTAPGDDGKTEQYIRSMAFYKGYLYAGTGSINGRVWKIDPVTKTSISLELPGAPSDAIYKGKYNEMGFVYGMNIVDHYLFVFYNGPLMMQVYDLDAEQWMSASFDNIRGVQAVSGYKDGKVYTSKKDGQMWEIAIDTMTEKAAMPFDGNMRTSKWVNLTNQSEFPNGAMVTVSFDGKIVLYDPTRKKSKSLPQVIRGQGINIQALETGPDGKIYLSTYMGSDGSQFDPATDKFTNFPLGQAEGIGFVGDTIYFGMYPKAEIEAYDTKTPLPMQTGAKRIFDIGNRQDRPFILSEGAGKLYIGTISGYGSNTGAITVYDPAASKASGQSQFEVFTDIVPEQSITGLLYKDGLVYGSTSIIGGLGGKPAPGATAKLFIWDTKSKKVIKTWEPEVPNIGTSTMISGLTLGKDGMIWASVNGIVFSFDPLTHKVVKSLNLYPEVNEYGQWRPIHQRWTQDGLLLTDTAGRLAVIDPVTMAYKTLLDKATLFTLDSQDRLYVASATKLMRYPKPEKPVKAPELIVSYLNVPNSGFEQKNPDGSIPGWTIETPLDNPSLFSVSTEQKKSGSSSLKLIDNSITVSSSVYSDLIPVAAGRDYVATTQLFHGDAPARPTGGYYGSSRSSAAVRYYDEAGKEIAGAGVTKHVDSSPKKWTQVELASKAPANAVSMRVVLYASPLWVTTAYYDDVTVYTKIYDNEIPTLTLESDQLHIAAETEAVMKATAPVNTEIVLTQGSNVISRAGGKGTEPTLLTLPAVSEGSHEYTVTVQLPGTGEKSVSRNVTVRAYPYTGLEIDSTHKEISLFDTVTAVTYAVYGPVRMDVSDQIQLMADPAHKVRISGTSIKTVDSGYVTISTKFQGKTAALSLYIHGGGSNSPSTPPPVTPNPVDPKPEDWKTEQTAGNQTTISVNTETLEKWLAQQGNPNTLVLATDSKSDQVQVKLTAAAAELLSKHNPAMAVRVQTPNGTFTLPVKDLASQLAGSASNSAAVHVNKLTSGQAAPYVQAIHNYNQAADLVEYKIETTVNGRTSVIGSLDGFAARSLTVKEGINPDHLVAVIIDPVTGSIRPVPAVFTSSGAKLWSMSGSGVFTVLENKQSFTDAAGHWAGADIEKLASKFIVNGMSDNVFGLDAKLTRAQLTAILVRALGIADLAGSSSGYSDIGASAWYSSDVKAAAQAGLIQGYEDGTFRPEQEINREEAAVIIQRAIAFTEQSASRNAGGPAAFEDVQIVSGWARDAVAELQQIGILNGKNGNEFAPKDDVTRAETAAMITRLLKSIQFMN
ncbi:S-layer homology domain-containing protein [Paenibacillus sp. FJAT-26967]|uniref:S-layer homology domain-containing protein n=1 Tax=Paenibacillus sp. FJAT-26967 TaxID=1729690 RepID=UPI0008392301|nr:S-layer homology domain-containing protein [Paenibacillus sp. FJAT-26967]